MAREPFDSVRFASERAAVASKSPTRIHAPQIGTSEIAAVIDSIDRLSNSLASVFNFIKWACVAMGGSALTIGWVAITDHFDLRDARTKLDYVYANGAPKIEKAISILEYRIDENKRRIDSVK